MSRESLNIYIKRTQWSFVNVKGRSYGQSVDHPASLSHLLHTILQSVPVKTDALILLLDKIAIETWYT